MFKKIIYGIISFAFVLSFSQIFVLGSYIGGQKMAVQASIIAQNVLFNLLPYIYQNCFNSIIYYSGIYNNTDKIDIVIGNHINAIDISIYASIIKQYDTRDIYVAYINGHIYVPGSGFIASMSPNIKISRNFNNDKYTIINTLKKIKKGIIFIFPEGTRYNDLKQKQSQQFSKDNNLHVFKNILYPKMKGIWLIVSCLHELNKLGNVIDITVLLTNYRNKECTTYKLFTTEIGNTFGVISSYTIMKNNFNDYNMFKLWFLDIWIKKDNILDKIQTKDDINIYKTINADIPMSSYILLILVTSIFIYLMSKSKGLFLPISLIITYLITMIIIFYDRIKNQHK